MSNDRALSTVNAGSGGLMLTNLDEYIRFADCVAKSGMAPKGMEKPEAILVAIQMGAEVGLPPMASLQNIAVINGRPGLWGDAMLGVCRKSGLFDEAAFDEIIETLKDGTIRATCTVRRLPNGKPIVRTFDTAAAKRAGLAGKAGPWQQYPERMTQFRARNWALRDGFADILKGLQAVEELRDIDAERTVDTPRKPRRVLQTEPIDEPAQVGGVADPAPYLKPAAAGDYIGDVDPLPRTANDAAKPADDDEFRQASIIDEVMGGLSDELQKWATKAELRDNVLNVWLGKIAAAELPGEVQESLRETVKAECNKRWEAERATRGGKQQRELLPTHETEV